MFSDLDLNVLRCPACRASLARGETSGEFVCRGCPERYPTQDELPRLYREREVTGLDRLFRLTFYDRMPRLHDLGVRIVLPFYEGDMNEEEFRAAYLPRLALEALCARDDREPLRVLEVGAGTCSNIPLMIEAIPSGLAVEVWGLDLSSGMLGRGLERVRRANLSSPDGSNIRLMLADAHALPLAEGSFDRVLHVGGIGAFRDPGLAMREMVRVARPGARIVVVDEALDTEREHSFQQLFYFWGLTPHDTTVQPPREHVPEGAHLLVDEQISRFYYCLAFQLPDEPAVSPPRPPQPGASP